MQLPRIQLRLRRRTIDNIVSSLESLREPEAINSLIFLIEIDRDLICLAGGNDTGNGK